MRGRLVALLVWLVLAASLIGAPRGVSAARHHSYVGTITKLSAASLTIHSKTHAADFTFAIVSSTRFMQHGQQISRARFRVGSYVYVSYSAGPHGSMIAYHIILRR